MLHIPQRSDGRTEEHHSAQHHCYIGDIRRVTLDLSNLSSISHPEAGVILHALSRITVTLLRLLRDREAHSPILTTG